MLVLQLALALRKQPAIDGPLRIVEIADFDRVACSGTHVGNTAEIGLIKVLRAELVSQDMLRRFEVEAQVRTVTDAVVVYEDITTDHDLPELTDDYDERTSMLGYRYFFGWYGGLTMAALAYGVFLLSRLCAEHGEPALIWIEELIEIAEQEASCELFGLLKRPDEKYVTERAYDNPKFVEDMVRDVACKLNEDDRIRAYVLESENFESIHNHSAYAMIEHDKDLARGL